MLIHNEPRPNAVQNTARIYGVLQRAVEKGAAGILVNTAIPGNITNSMGGVKQVPTFSIGSEDADALKALLAKGPVKVHAKLLTEEQPGLKDNNIWGTLPGASPEEVVVIAHHDGPFEAAFDNASGTATMIGIAEYFARIPQANRRRTLRFVSTGAHKEGSAGAAAIHNNRAALIPNAVLVFNCEHTSVTQMNQFGPIIRKTTQVNARQWWVNGSDKLASIAFDAYRSFGVAIWDDAMYEGGDIGPLSRDQASINLIVSPVYYGSDYDRPDVVPPSGLEGIARAYAKIIDQTGQLTREQLQSAAPAPSSAQAR